MATADKQPDLSDSAKKNQFLYSYLYNTIISISYKKMSWTLIYLKNKNYVYKYKKYIFTDVTSKYFIVIDILHLTTIYDKQRIYILNKFNEP